MALLSIRERAGALALLEEVTYVELSDRAGLQRPVRRPPRVPELTAGRRVALIACGAHRPARGRRRRATRLAGRRPPPAAAAAQPAAPDRRARSAALAVELAATYGSVAVGYADCGTYGALDAVCDELGLRRLPGLHCYDLFAGEAALAALLDEPSPAPTSSPTSWCAPSTARSCASSVSTATPSCATTTSATTRGSSGWPRSPTPSCARSPSRRRTASGLPLTVVPTGTGRLEQPWPTCWPGCWRVFRAVRDVSALPGPPWAETSRTDRPSVEHPEQPLGLPARLGVLLVDVGADRDPAAGAQLPGAVAGGGAGCGSPRRGRRGRRRRSSRTRRRSAPRAWPRRRGSPPSCAAWAPRSSSRPGTAPAAPRSW